MSVQIITVLCEGPHDVAFIGRLLKSIGFKSNESTKIGDYPKPFDRLLISEASKSDISQLNLTEIRRNLLPTNVLLQDNKYVFLYSMHGDSKKIARQRMLKELRSFISEPGEIEILPSNTILSLLYFFDADDRGVTNRLSDIHKEVAEALENDEVHNFINNGFSTSVSGLKLGAFIFSDESNVVGKLEDVLVPLMNLDNEEIFDQADEFLKDHYSDERLFPLKLTVNQQTNSITEARSQKAGDKEKYDNKKSLIGTVAQLQKSGKSNVVCISDSDFITLDKIVASKKCQEIVDFFKKFIS